MSVDRLTIEELSKIVAARRGGDPKESYTAKLLNRGVSQCGKKLGEEAVELVIAAMQGDRDAVRSEAADLLYHFVVLLSAAEVELEEVYSELGQRAGVSGHQEKAGRRY